jgi:hypothetical protein
MTFVYSVRSRDSFWIVADRRLSRRGRVVKDDAIKVMALETMDGSTGVIGYAGVGETPHGTQPSDWMSAVLRGRQGLTFEQAMVILSNAANQQLPRFLSRELLGHFMIIPAFVRGVGALHVIENIRTNDGRSAFRYGKMLAPGLPVEISPRVGGAGSGMAYFSRIGLTRTLAFQRELFSLVKDHDHGRISDYVIADRLAHLNYEVHQAYPDTVGPRCVVVWRRRPGIRWQVPGGKHVFYTGLTRELSSPAIPAIQNGWDAKAVVGALFEQMMNPDGTLKPLGFRPDPDTQNQRLSELPTGPDERLR